MVKMTLLPPAAPIAGDEKLAIVQDDEVVLADLVDMLGSDGGAIAAAAAAAATVAAEASIAAALADANALRTDLASADPAKGAALAGYKHALPGAVARTTRAKLDDMVHIADFGPVGTANDTATFAAAAQAGVSVYVPPLPPTAGNVPQTPYMVDEIVLYNGTRFFGQFGQTYIKQRAGANKDLVKLANQNVSNFALDGLMLDGNRANNSSGRGVNLVGNPGSVAAYNPQGHPDPYCYIGNLFIFNTAGDGFRLASDATDGAWRSGGTVIENVRTLHTGGRGAYISAFDISIDALDCGDTGLQAIEFSQNCGSINAKNLKGWYSGQSDATKGECIILRGSMMSFQQVYAQANIPGHGIVLDYFYDSEVDFRIQGAGNVAGFGSTPAYLAIKDTSTSFRAHGVCTQQGGAPVGAIDLVTFIDTAFAGVSANYDINITASGTYTNLRSGYDQFPVIGGNILQSLVINGRQMLGITFTPIWPAGQNPASGWTEYCDNSYANQMMLLGKDGQLVAQTPIQVNIANLPVLTANHIDVAGYVLNGPASVTAGTVPSATGTARQRVRWDPIGLVWRYVEGGGGGGGVWTWKGVIDCSTNPNYPAASAGFVWKASVAGKIGGASGVAVDAGDLIVANADNAGGTQVAVGGSWDTFEHNGVFGGGGPSGFGAFATLTDEATVTPNAAASNNFIWIIGGNRTLAFPTGLVDGQEIRILVVQDGTGGRTWTPNGKYKFSGGAPALSSGANAKDMLVGLYNAALDIMICSLGKGFA